MSAEESTSRSGASHSGAAVPYDYGYGDKKAESGKVSRFNGDPEEFSWWKTNFYSYVMGLDEELTHTWIFTCPQAKCINMGA